MQLATAPMLGCLLSHMEIWASVGPNETVAVFEEDAYIDQVSVHRLALLLADLRGVPWNILMLESGSMLATGRCPLFHPPFEGLPA